jgi:hypothetical protein
MPQNENTSFKQKAGNDAKQFDQIVGNVTINEYNNSLPPADDKPVKKSGYFYDQPIKKLSFVALSVIAIYGGYTLIISEPEPEKENPLRFSNVKRENGKNLIVFKAPEVLYRTWMMNKGKKPLIISTYSFPEKFFYISLLDEGFIELNPGRKEKKLIIVVKKSINPDASEYSFTITINDDPKRSTPMMIKLEGDWGNFYLAMATQLEQQTSEQNHSILETHEAAVEIVTKAYPRIKPHIQQIVAGQLLSRQGHFKAATVAYQKAEKLNHRISDNPSFKLMVASAQDNDAQPEPTFKKTVVVDSFTCSPSEFLLKRDGRRIPVSIHTPLQLGDEILVLKKGCFILLRSNDNKLCRVTKSNNKLRRGYNNNFNSFVERVIVSVSSR